MAASEGYAWYTTGMGHVTMFRDKCRGAVWCHTKNALCVKQWHSQSFCHARVLGGQALQPCNTHIHAHLHLDINTAF